MNVLNNIPTAYEGNEPYIFISYAHKDSARVLPFILKMQQAGLRVWFDKGIEAGSEWPEYIEKRLEGADSVVAFISAASVASLNCRNEINLAFAEKKKMLVIYLEETELRHGMKLQLSSVQSMFAYDSANDEERVREVCDILGKKTTTPSVPPVQSAAPSSKSKKPMWIALAAAFVAICLCICLPLLLRETKTNTVLNEQYHATLVLNESDVSKDAVFLIKEVSAVGTLRAAIQKLSVNQSSYHVYDMSLWVDKTEIEIDGTVGITMPIPAGISEDKAVIYRILGEMGEKVVSSVIDGKLSFTADELGLYVIAERADSQSSEHENEDDDKNGNTENNGGSSDTEEIPVTKTTILSFNANGGNGTMEAQTVTVGKASNLNTCTFTKVGYVFGGWATSADGDVAYMDGASFLTDSETATTLYAVWIPNTNSLVFHANGGAGSMSAVTVDTNETITLPTNVFKRLGYTFKGWSTVKNGTVNYTDGQSFQMTASATVTLYAVWSANTYSVTLKANDGTEGEVNFSMKTDEMQNLPANTFTRKGYTFAGWSTTALGSVEFTDKASYTMGSAAATLYAVWQPNANKIVFNANGGSGTMADQIVSTGAKANLNDCAFTYEGFIFAGWATAPDGNVAYANTASYTMGEEALYILYAIWTKSAYVITYQTNGGSNNLNNPVGYDVDTDTIVLADPTRDGYSFSGWYTEPSLANKITTIPKGSTGHKTLYASWTANTNSINFNANGGSGVMSAQKAKTDEKVSLKQNAFTRSGYTFAGWSISAEGNAVYTNGASYTVSSDASVTLYAVWTPIMYTVTYDLQGGTVSGNESTYNITEPFTLLNPTKAGYTFLGWTCEDVSEPTLSATVAGRTEDLHFVAHWKANTDTPYKVEYYFENLAGNGYELRSSETERKTGTTDKTASVSPKSFDHFRFNFNKSTLSGKIDANGKLVLKVYYDRNTYTVTTTSENSKGGTVTAGATKPYGSEFTVTATPNIGYTFDGWYEGDTKVCDTLTFTFNVEKNVIYTAKWSADEDTPYTINFYKENMTKTGYTVVFFDSITLYGTTDTITTYIADALDGYFLNSDKNVLSGNINGDGTLTLSVYYKNTYYREGNYIYFGEYPQSLKEGNVTITDTVDSRGYYLGSDGAYYAKVLSYPESGKNTFSNGTTVEYNKTYYFKVEPIRWSILEEADGEALILCDSIIDATGYDSYGGDNNYEDSKIRAWLNQNFYETAFNDLQQEIIMITQVDNSAASTGFANNSYSCADTYDKIFLLSYTEITSSAYGFSSTGKSNDTARKMDTSDFARANGAYMSRTFDYGCGWYWLRSPHATNSEYARVVTYTGYIKDNYDCFYSDGQFDIYRNSAVNYAGFGVVPAMRIKL